MKVRLGDYIEEYSVRNKKGEDIPVYSVTNTQGFCKDYFGKEVASKDKTTYKIVPRGCFAFNPSRINVGSVDWQRNEERVIVSPLYNVFSVSKQLDQQYLYYYLKSDFALQRIRAVATGSVRDNLKLAMLYEFPIELPDITEQRIIVDKLDRVKQIISLREKEVQALDDLIKARFVEMFGDCRLNPMGWNTVALGDIAEVGSSKRVFVEELKETGIPFYRGTEVGAFAEGRTVTPELFITEEHYYELINATGKPQPGDLLMPSICPDGRIWVVDTDKPFYFKDGRVLWVHEINKSFDPVFLLYTLKDRIMSDYSSIASGTTFAELKICSLKQCQVFDVPIEKQRRFAAFIAQVDKSKAVIQKSLDETQLLFDSLMQKYFG